MSSPFDFDRRLTAWLDDEAPMRAPDALLGTVVERAAKTRRRPAWATLERWISMETRAQLWAVPRGAIILVTLALLTALLGIAIAIGASPAPKFPDLRAPARNGLIAYDSNGDIWVTKLDGTDKKQLTSGPDVDRGAIVSPDGKHIAYWNKADVAGESALMVMDPDGSHPHALVQGLKLISWSDAGMREPTWSHDSKRLAYPDRFVSGLTSTDRINFVPLAGGSPVELARPADGPTWSPNDAFIA